MFQDPFSFDGRIRRTEYCLSYLALIPFVFLVYFGLHMLAALRPIAIIMNILGIFFVFLWLGLMWFMLAQGAKRCHDRGNSGWFQLIPFYRLWMVFADSEYGPNEYGLNPKGQGNQEEG